MENNQTFLDIRRVFVTYSYRLLKNNEKKLYKNVAYMAFPERDPSVDVYYIKGSGKKIILSPREIKGGKPYKIFKKKGSGGVFITLVNVCDSSKDYNLYKKKNGCFILKCNEAKQLITEPVTKVKVFKDTSNPFLNLRISIPKYYTDKLNKNYTEPERLYVISETKKSPYSMVIERKDPDKEYCSTDHKKIKIIRQLTNIHISSKIARQCNISENMYLHIKGNDNRIVIYEDSSEALCP